MRAYADTSFLFALYRRQPGNERAIEWLEAAGEPPLASVLLVFEFTQAVRFEVFRRSRDHTKGCSEEVGLSILAQFDEHISQGTIEIVGIEPAIVLREAARLSEQHTIRQGHRAFDILHVATALILGAQEFLTFDAGQRLLAEAEGLAIPL